MLLLKDTELIRYFRSIGEPLPFGLSTLRKDRLDGRLGIPYRPIGGSKLYCPDDVVAWLSDRPLVVPTRQTKLANEKPPFNRYKPSKEESVKAERLGITVGDLRAREGTV